MRYHVIIQCSCRPVSVFPHKKYPKTAVLAQQIQLMYHFYSNFFYYESHILIRVFINVQAFPEHMCCLGGNLRPKPFIIYSI